MLFNIEEVASACRQPSQERRLRCLQARPEEPQLTGRKQTFLQAGESQGESGVWALEVNWIPPSSCISTLESLSSKKCPNFHRRNLMRLNLVRICYVNPVGAEDKIFFSVTGTSCSLTMSSTENIKPWAYHVLQNLPCRGSQLYFLYFSCPSKWPGWWPQSPRSTAFRAPHSQGPQRIYPSNWVPRYEYRIL